MCYVLVRMRVSLPLVLATLLTWGCTGSVGSGGTSDASMRAGDSGQPTVDAGLIETSDAGLSARDAGLPAPDAGPLPGGPAPSWMSAAAEWAKAPNSSYYGMNSPRYAWSGGCVNTVGVFREGAFVPGTFIIGHGGGHSDSSSNSVEAYGPLESETPVWSVVRAATEPPPLNVPRDANGNPVSVHTYDGVVFDAVTNEMIRVPVAAMYNLANSFGGSDIFRFEVDPAGQPWYSVDEGLVTSGNFADNVMAVIDPTDGTVWAVGKAVPTWVAKRTRGATKWVSTEVTGGHGEAGGGAFHPTSKLLVWVDRTEGKVAVRDLRGTPTQSAYLPATTGTGPGATIYQPALAWDPVAQHFIVWPNGEKTLWYLTPGANPYEGGDPWVWTTFTPDGGLSPPVATGSGKAYFGRFAIIVTPTWSIITAEWDGLYYLRLR